METVLNHLQALPDGLIYVLLGLSAFVENIFPPIPGDTITAFGAFLVGIGRLDFTGVYTATTLGSLFGFMALFWIGRLLGERYLIERDYRFLRAEKIIKAGDWFNRYGYFLIAINRFLPGVRSAIAVSGGISKLKPLHAVLLALSSCAVWNLIWILLGYVLGTHWDLARARLSDIMAKYNLSIGFLFILFIGFILVRKWVRRKGKQG